jgi:hypothetical protein
LAKQISGGAQAPLFNLIVETMKNEQKVVKFTDKKVLEAYIRAEKIEYWQAVYDKDTKQIIFLALVKAEYLTEVEV